MIQGTFAYPLHVCAHVCVLLYVATKAPCAGDYSPTLNFLSPELKIAGVGQGTDLSSGPFSSIKERQVHKLPGVLCVSLARHRLGCLLFIPGKTFP